MGFGKRALIVAPDTDLYYSAKEVESVVNILGANLLNGKVEVDDLVDRIRILQPELIIFSSHGTKDGILLSDGIIGANLLKPILSTTNAECVYLNTCDSLETARKLSRELPTSLVANVQGIPDIMSYVTMSSFAHHLDKGLNYQEAWELSRTGSNIDSQFFPQSRNLFGDDDDMNEKTRDKQKEEFGYAGPSLRDGNGYISDLHEEVSRLSYLIYGNPKWNLIGILPTITKLQRDCYQVRLLLVLLLVLIALLMAVVAGWLLPI